MSPSRLCLILCALACAMPFNASAADPAARGTNLAAGCAVIFDTPPNDVSSTDPDDPRQLTDGELSPATPIWYDKSTVGWALTDPTVFTLDLGAIRPIRGVGLHMGAGQAGVEWPSGIQLYVSDDGGRFSHVGDLMQLLAEPPPAAGYATIWLTTDRLQTHGRFVRFVCTPVNLGNGVYIMLDEIEVYQGDPAWLDRPLIWPEAPGRWRALWPQMTWTDNAGATPPSERPRRLVLVDGADPEPDDSPLLQVVSTDDRATFTFRGEAGTPRSMSWTGKLDKPISAANCPFALLTFQASGVRRTHHVHPLVALQGVSDKGGAGAVVLLEANVALNDGLSHTLVKPLPAGFALQQIKVSLPTSDDAPRLDLLRLELTSAPPDVFSTEITPAPDRPDSFTPIPLGAALNASLTTWFDQLIARHAVALDGARDLKPGPVSVSGVPFDIAAGERNLALMPESPEPNQRVQFLGQTVDSRNLGPQSRDDSLSIDVDASAREAFLLIALNAPPLQARAGLPTCPLRLDDIECISVELTYEGDLTTTAFPYSLADRGCYLPARELGAYAVAVDPSRRLKRITLRSHFYGLGFALAGLTLNTSATPLVPDLADFPPPEQVAQNPEPPARPAAVTLEGQRLTFSNRWYEFSFDLAHGFSLDRVINRCNPAANVTLAPSSGLRARVGDTLYTGRCFQATVLHTTPTTARLKLTGTRPELTLEITLTITAHDSPELTFAAEATNLGAEPLEAELSLPALSGLSIGSLPQTRLFFPQYRAVDTAQPIALRAPYGPEFATQFMDVYNPSVGVGLMLRTDNRDQRMAAFALRKDVSGVSGGVCFPAEYNRLEPGATRTYPPVSVLAHGGDWRQAFDLYRDWVRTWYAPHNSQDEPYFLNAWDMQCYRPNEKLCWLESRLPAVISPDHKRFLMDETFAFEQRYLGHLPDLVHFFNWTYNDEKGRSEYGVYGTPLAYEQLGGLDFLGQCVTELQAKWRRPLSLYTLSDRFRASALPDPKLSRELAARAPYKELENDSSAALRGAGQADGVIFPAFGDPLWTDFFVDDITKMQRDTGCQIVYMDVFPRFSNLRGYQGLSPRDDDLAVIRRVRDALPDEVALWTEYPLTDVASQYADGCLQYYFLDLNQTFAPRFNRSDQDDDLALQFPLDLLRYALPRYRTFLLGGYAGISNRPGQVDAAFINGEAYFEDTYHLEHTRLRARINRGYAIKREYADCFLSATPMPRVQTAATGITANLFPGEGRQLWTLFNARPATYSGVVLTVPHVAGARYRDAWNGRDLAPVIDGNVARISLTLDPQQPGCIVQDVQP